MNYIRSISKRKDIWHTLDHYVQDIPSLQSMNSLSLESPVTFFVGENGSGKSTLLEAIAVKYGFNPEGGSKNYSFTTKSTHSSLSDALELIKAPKQAKDGFFLRAESFYNMATYMEEVDDDREAGISSRDYLNSYFDGVSPHEQSHGESFLSLVNNRFWGNGIYILDEPEAALSPSRQLTLLTYINRLVKQNSQFIIATHSPILLAFPQALIYSFDNQCIKPIAYEETDHYQITRNFLNHPERMLRILMDE